MSDSRDTLIEILKEKYYYELKRKQYYDDALGVPITLLSFLVAGVYIVLSEDNTDKLKEVFVTLKWVLIIVLLLASLITFVFLFKVYFGFNRLYSSLPDSSSIVYIDYKNITDRHESIKPSDKFEDFVTSDLKEYQIIWYTDCNSANTSLNDKRGESFYRSRISLGISLIFGIFLLIFICISKTDMAEKPSTPPPPPTPVRQEKADIIAPAPTTKQHEQK